MQLSCGAIILDAISYTTDEMSFLNFTNCFNYCQIFNQLFTQDRRHMQIVALGLDLDTKPIMTSHLRCYERDSPEFADDFRSGFACQL